MALDLSANILPISHLKIYSVKKSQKVSRIDSEMNKKTQKF